MASKPKQQSVQPEQKPSAPPVLVRPDTRVSEWEQPNMAAGFDAPTNCLPQECYPEFMSPMPMAIVHMRRG